MQEMINTNVEEIHNPTSNKDNPKKQSNKKFIFASLSPVMLIFAIFTIIPIVWGILLSFYDYNPLQAKSDFVGLENFQRLLKEELFIKSFLNTFKFVLIAVPANIILTLVIALGISSIRSQRLKNIIRVFYFLPVIAPLSGSAVVWATMFNYDSGILNLLLVKIGIHPVEWLSDPKMAMISIIIMTLWADMGFNIIIYLAGLESIPTTIYEASKLDGANRLRTFWHITLPLLSRTTLFVTVMTCISYFQMFPQFQILTNGEPENETRVLALHIYDTAFSYMDMGYASTIASVLFVIILIITFIQMKFGRSKWDY